MIEFFLVVLLLGFLISCAAIAFLSLVGILVRATVSAEGQRAVERLIYSVFAMLMCGVVWTVALHLTPR